MKTESKIQLSPQEFDLVNNPGWILTKNEIILKVKHLLQDLLQNQQDYIQSLRHQLPEEILRPSPKISKGENYKGLPYLILDYPRFFEQKDIFAIRTMFWWGNFFSITLHLSGNYKILFTEKIINGYNALKEKEFYVCSQEEQWDHHFENYNYMPLSEWSRNDFERKINSGSFIKIANKISLNQWDDAQHHLLEYFKLINKVLAI